MIQKSVVNHFSIHALRVMLVIIHFADSDWEKIHPMRPLTATSSGP